MKAIPMDGDIKANFTVRQVIYWDRELTSSMVLRPSDSLIYPLLCYVERQLLFIAKLINLGIKMENIVYAMLCRVPNRRLATKKKIIIEAIVQAKTHKWQRFKHWPQKTYTHINFILNNGLMILFVYSFPASKQLTLTNCKLREIKTK